MLVVHTLDDVHPFNVPEERSLSQPIFPFIFASTIIIIMLPVTLCLQQPSSRLQQPLLQCSFLLLAIESLWYVPAGLPPSQVKCSGSPAARFYALA